MPGSSWWTWSIRLGLDNALGFCNVSSPGPKSTLHCPPFPDSCEDRPRSVGAGTGFRAAMAGAMWAMRPWEPWEP